MNAPFDHKTHSPFSDSRCWFPLSFYARTVAAAPCVALFKLFNSRSVVCAVAPQREAARSYLGSDIQYWVDPCGLRMFSQCGLFPSITCTFRLIGDCQ